MPADIFPSKQMYTPPNGIYFRLQDRDTGLYIYSDNERTPEVSVDQRSDADDQFFTLIPGTGDQEGTFAIQGKASGKVLFSVAKGDVKVGHADIGAGGPAEESLFKFLEGTDELTGAFRIQCPATKTELYADLSMNPPLGNRPASDVAKDAFFNFDFETVEIKAVNFDLSSGQVTDPAASTLYTESFTNETEEPLEHFFEINLPITGASLFAYHDGFPILAGSEESQFATQLPTFNADHEVTLGEETTTVHFGFQETFTTNIRASVPVSLEPGQTATVKVVAERASIRVPFTITLASKSTGAETETTGEWVGEVFGNVTFPREVN
ncbi:hypothetical protein C8Q77DRAFT_1160104 [Trametes polyzona]|nr:hypothetical protein C8Q77DRAFT_1160104 [Trametes polyzona]